MCIEGVPFKLKKIPKKVGILAKHVSNKSVFKVTTLWFFNNQLNFFKGTQFLTLPCAM